TFDRCAQLYLISAHSAPGYTHSFPTRRSSDLTYAPLSTVTCASRASRRPETSAAVRRRISHGSRVGLATNSSRRSNSTLTGRPRSEEHTSELQSRVELVCRLLLEKKNHIHSMT